MCLQKIDEFLEFTESKGIYQQAISCEDITTLFQRVIRNLETLGYYAVYYPSLIIKIVVNYVHSIQPVRIYLFTKFCHAFSMIGLVASIFGTINDLIDICRLGYFYIKLYMQENEHQRFEKTLERLMQLPEYQQKQLLPLWVCKTFAKHPSNVCNRLKSNHFIIKKLILDSIEKKLIQSLLSLTSNILAVLSFSLSIYLGLFFVSSALTIVSLCFFFLYYSYKKYIVDSQTC